MEAFPTDPAASPPDIDRRPAAWRWRFHDPRTGERVDHSEPLTAQQVLAINPRAELIPGSRIALGEKR